MQSGVDDDVLNQWLAASSDEEEDEFETTEVEVNDEDAGRGGDSGDSGNEEGISRSAEIQGDGASCAETENIAPFVSGGDLEARSAGKQEHVPDKPESVNTQTQVPKPKSEKVNVVSRTRPAAAAPTKSTKSTGVSRSGDVAGSIPGTYAAEKKQMKRVMKPRLYDLLGHGVFLEGNWHFSASLCCFTSGIEM